MGRHSTAIDTTTLTPPLSPSSKRKREEITAEEIEVDVTAPEPPSKKALRKAKKGKATPDASKAESKSIGVQAGSVLDEDASADISATSKRSEYGIWIGNLPWTATKADLRNFLTKDTGISENMITRLHLPAPRQGIVTNSKQRIKPQNKGFAYIDFSTEEALTEALALSERLLTGRRVLIKDSKSFEGRPDRTKEQETAIVNSGKPPSKRIFVGNLAFETTKQDLENQFTRCGEMLDVHIATFEDTGKCKGYAWVEFAELEAGEAAMRGWVNFEQKADSGDEDEEIAEALAGEADVKPKKKPKLRKWWVNKLHGRPLKLEFAEGKDVRYKKRYGKDGSASKDGVKVVDPEPESMAQPAFKDPTSSAKRPPRRLDARTVKPGAALAAAPRLTGGIVESQGKKTTFT
ncbi:hypothetical protein HO173_007695 [Letharia columbiana]|uniref:RRM domain-containing protein n=1 Tax=Letharia columbiana TaxID=112416 RepID=A0A8H6L3K6_9LECA|nr:uncharacterized protein HO173_007695 [Letharia columbiana]KAF6234273.1 hypothetical protein HO173_007695 [Letharia columbiana]